MRVWADCTAAAHPLVLRPIIEGLRERGHEVEVTAREYGQTRPGSSTGSGSSTRSSGATAAPRPRARPARSRPAARHSPAGLGARRFDLALAHGSVDVAAVGTLLRIPSVQMQDYEWAGLQRKLSWRIARRVIVPDAIPIDRLERAGAAPAKLFRYPGLKEDYYLAGFEPDPLVLEQLVDRSRPRARGRPPAARDLGLPRGQPASTTAVIDRLAADRRRRPRSSSRGPSRRPPALRARNEPPA